MKKFLVSVILFLFLPYSATAIEVSVGELLEIFNLRQTQQEQNLGAITSAVWNIRLGTYLQPAASAGLGVLIYGTNKYLSFGSTYGSSGYGLRDSSGTIQFKHSGGSWADIGSGGTTINQLGQIGDVSTTTLDYGSVLMYDTGASEWTSVATSSLGITEAGTVTSVDMTVPTGLSVSGNPITTTGTLAVALTAGYSIPTIASQTSWDNKWDLASSTIAVAYGGTGSTTLSGILKGNGTGAIQTAVSGTDYQPAGNYILLTSLSSTATGLTYNNTTGEFSFTAGYSIPTDVKQASWDNKWDLASSTIDNASLTNSTIGLTSTGSITIGTSPISLGGTSALNLSMAHANTWTALQTFANASTTLFSTSYASSTNAYFGNTYIPSLGTAAGTLLAADSTGKLIATSTPSGGGTVTSIATTFPILGGTITDTGTITFGGLSTSTDAVIGNLPYFSGVNTFANIATTTLTGTAPIVFSEPISVIGGSASAISCSAASGSSAGCLSAANWTTFNNKWDLSSSTIGIAYGGTGQTSFASDSIITINGSGAFTASTTISEAFIDSAIARDSELPTGANPSGTVGLSVVNGSATTFLRSDGAPALSEAIQPTWSALHTFSGGVTLGHATSTSFAVTELATAAGTLIAIDPTGKLIATSTPSGGGTVTSVAMTVPTGFDIAGSPIVDSGTLAVSFTSGYSLPTTAKQTSWDNKWDLASSTIGVAYGGTGTTTWSIGEVVVVGASSLTGTTTANLKTSMALNNVENTALSTWAGSANITTLGTISTGAWSGTEIGAVKGGTGQTTWTTGDLLYASAENTLSKLGVGASSTVLTINASSAPVWTASPAFTSLRITGTATTTSAGGFDISGGCFAINGTCVGGAGGGSGTVNAGTTGQAAYYASNGTAVSGSDLLTISATKIGIGTTTPFAKFSITGTTGTYPLLVASSTGTTLLSVSHDDVVTVGGGTGHVFFDLSGSSKIGVASSTPTHMLSVVGKVYATEGIVFGDGSLQTAAAAGASAGTAGQFAYYLSDGTTVSGTSTLSVSADGKVSAGTATAFQIPYGATPVLSATGQIAFDTTDNQFLIATTTTNTPVVLPSIQKIYGGTIASTSVDFISGGRIPLPPQRDGFVIKEIHCFVDGGTSKVINLDTLAGGANTDSVTCATTNTKDTAMSANFNIAAETLMALELGATTGTVDYVTFSVFGIWVRK